MAPDRQPRPAPCPCSPADEDRHPPGVEPGWEESWSFDFATPGGDLGGHIALTLRPPARRAWLWAALVGDRRPLVTVVDDELGMPPVPGLTVRSDGLWCDPVCETPFEHWSIGLEAFGVALEDPRQGWEACRGDRTALGLDLEWEAGGPVEAWVPRGSEVTGYALAAEVHGDVLVDDEVIVLDGWGHRRHGWGPGAGGAGWTAGRRSDGSTWHALAPAGGVPAPIPRRLAAARVAGTGGGSQRLGRVLGAVVDAQGRPGVGWTAWSEPAGRRR